jgi:hypothetical protein
MIQEGIFALFRLLALVPSLFNQAENAAHHRAGRETLGRRLQEVLRTLFHLQLLAHGLLGLVKNIR